MVALIAESFRFPDLEALVMDLAAQVEIDGVPIGTQATGTTVPGQVGSRFVHVERTPGTGGLDRHGITDTALIYIGTRAETRAVSRQITHELRDLLLELDRTHTYREILIDRCEESSAPGPLNGADPDERLVETGWVLAVRRHRGPNVEPS